MKRYGRRFAWAALICGVALFCCTGCQARAEDEIQALFINVGKADAILLRLDGGDYLIDTGTKDSFEQMERALSAYGVTELEGVIVSHQDKDHVGGLKKLLKSDIIVRRVYAGALYAEEYEGDHPAMEAAEKRNAPFSWLAAGDTIPAGKSTLTVLGPLRRDPDEENNNSLAIHVQTPQGDLLLTGDMELEEETELLEAGLVPQAEVLKVAHHGGEDSTSQLFVRTVRPQWAVISTSSAERPSTPDGKVMARLWEIKAGVAVTQQAEVGVLITLRGGEATAEEINWE